jgi:Domain of unknown function (DUF5658)
VSSLSKSLLLFALNWLDAQLTILWLRLNVATEANTLMAGLTNHSEASFLLVKLFIGALAAYVLYRCAHVPMAQRGMRLVLGIYFGLLMLHLVTGFSTLGWHAPETVLAHLFSLPRTTFTFLL